MKENGFFYFDTWKDWYESTKHVAIEQSTHISCREMLTYILKKSLVKIN
jgi:hypothetical protein